MRCELELQKGDFHYTSNGRHRVPDPLPQKAEGKGSGQAPMADWF